MIFSSLQCALKRDGNPSMNGRFLQVGREFKSVLSCYEEFRLIQMGHTIMVYFGCVRHGIGIHAKTNLIELYCSITFFESNCRNITNLFFDVVCFRVFYELPDILKKRTYVHSSKMPYEWRKSDDLYPFHSPTQFR